MTAPTRPPINQRPKRKARMNSTKPAIPPAIPTIRTMRGSAPSTAASPAARAKPTRNPVSLSDRTPKKHRTSPTARPRTPLEVLVAAVEPAFAVSKLKLLVMCASSAGPSSPSDDVHRPVRHREGELTLDLEGLRRSRPGHHPTGVSDSTEG